MYPPASAGPEIIGYGDNVSTLFSLAYENAIPGTLTIYTAPAPAGGATPVFTAFSATAPISVATTSAAGCGIGVQTITPGTIGAIAVGKSVRLDPGLATQEDCVVTAQVGSTFQVTTTLAHSAGFSIIGTPAYSVGAPSTGVDNTNATNQVVSFLAAPATGVIVAARCQLTAFSDSDLTFYLTAAQGLYSDDLSVLKRVQFDILSVIMGDQRRMTILSEGAFKTDPGAYVAGLAKLKDQLWKELEGGPVAQVNIPQFGVTVRGAGRYTPYR